MSRGKKATEAEFYKVKQLIDLELTIADVASITKRSNQFIKDMIDFDNFEDYEHRNDQLKANKIVEQQNLNLPDDMFRPVGDYVDSHFRAEVLEILRQALAFRPTTETEVMQFIEDNENNVDLIQRINWQSFTKLPKYKEKHDV